MFYLFLFLIIFLVALFSFISSAIVIIPISSIGLVERFGKYFYTINNGIHFIPIFSTAKTVDMRDRTISIEHQNIITADNVNISIDGILIGSCFDPYKFIYKVTNPIYAIESLVHTKLRSICGHMSLFEILSSRDSINTKLLDDLNLTIEQWGFSISFVQIKDINAPIDIQNIMSKQLEASMEKSRIMLINEGQNNTVINKATVDLEATKLGAEAIIVKAAAETKAKKLILDLFSNYDLTVVNQLLCLSHVNAIENIKAGSNNNFIVALDSINNIIESFKKGIKT